MTKSIKHMEPLRPTTLKIRTLISMRANNLFLKFNVFFCCYWLYGSPFFNNMEKKNLNIVMCKLVQLFFFVMKLNWKLKMPIKKKYCDLFSRVYFFSDFWQFFFLFLFVIILCKKKWWTKVILEDIFIFIDYRKIVLLYIYFI